MNTETTALSVEQLYRLDGDGKLKAFADINIAGMLMVKGFRVIDGKNGLFVSMPSHQGKNEQWFDSVKPLSQEVRARLNEVILAAYQSASVGDR